MAISSLDMEALRARLSYTKWGKKSWLRRQHVSSRFPWPTAPSQFRKFICTLSVVLLTGVAFKCHGIPTMRINLRDAHIDKCGRRSVYCMQPRPVDITIVGPMDSLVLRAKLCTGVRCTTVPTPSRSAFLIMGTRCDVVVGWKALPPRSGTVANNTAEKMDVGVIGMLTFRDHLPPCA